MAAPSTSRSYVRAATVASWRSSTLLFWVAAAAVAAVVLGAAWSAGSTVDRVAPTPVPVFELRAEALRVAAEATAGVDVSDAAMALAERAGEYPAAAGLAVAARELADGTGSPTLLALAADRMLVEQRLPIGAPSP